MLRMIKNFRYGSVLPILVLVIALLNAFQSSAQVNITAGSAAMCIGGDPATVSDIIIQESSLEDFGNNCNCASDIEITIQLSSGDFQFVAGQGSATAFPGSDDIINPLTVNVLAN